VKNPSALPPCPIWIWHNNLELNDSLHSEKPVSNQLSCGMPSVCLFGFKAEITRFIPTLFGTLFLKCHAEFHNGSSLLFMCWRYVASWDKIYVFRTLSFQTQPNIGLKFGILMSGFVWTEDPLTRPKSHLF